MSSKQKGTASPAVTAAVVGTAAKKTGIAALRAVLGRRHVIVATLGVAAAATLLFFLVQLVPRTVKPTVYRVGELELASLTQVVGHRKLLSMRESLTGLGRAASGEYSYQAGREPKKDVEEYLALLSREYGAQLPLDAQLGEASGSVTVQLPTGDEQSQVELNILYDSEHYTLQLDEKQVPKPRPEKVEAKITPEQARDILLTLTKAETGFKQDISVYTSQLEPDTMNVDGWDYYVFTIVADYSATRIEYRGTFYIACHDGAILRYDKETDTTSRIAR